MTAGIENKPLPVIGVVVASMVAGMAAFLVERLLPGSLLTALGSDAVMGATSVSGMGVVAGLAGLESLAGLAGLAVFAVGALRVVGFAPAEGVTDG